MGSAIDAAKGSAIGTEEWGRALPKHLFRSSSSAIGTERWGRALPKHLF